jgi:hypothetical protein
MALISHEEEPMKQTLTTAALATSIMLASLSAALGAEGTHRYGVVSQPTQRVEVRVTGSGSTWFTGTEAHGEKLAVVFLPRFATIVRDGTRVPVSYLKAGDTVQVEGQITERRLAASSAYLTPPSMTTAKASQVP